MGFQNQLQQAYLQEWNQALLKLRVRLNYLYQNKGIQVQWREDCQFVRGIGTVKSLTPIIIYQRPSPIGVIPFDPVLAYRRELSNVTEEFFSRLEERLSEAFGKMVLEKFNLEQLQTFAKNLDKMSTLLEGLETSQENLIATREAKSYAIEAEYFRKRKAWQLRTKEERIS